jgi:hypothetical protein
MRPLPPPPHRRFHQICRRVNIRSNSSAATAANSSSLSHAERPQAQLWQLRAEAVLKQLRQRIGSPQDTHSRWLAKKQQEQYMQSMSSIKSCAVWSGGDRQIESRGKMVAGTVPEWEAPSAASVV